MSTSKRAQALPRGRFAAATPADRKKPVTAGSIARYASSLTVLLALVVALTTACSHAAASNGATSMRLADCGGNPQTRPQVVVVTCSSTDITAHNLKWQSWGSKIATATGYAVVNVCAFSDCHTGAYGSFPIVVVASGTTACPGGAHGYSRIQYLFVGASPFANLPAHMKVPPTFFGKPGVGPPIISRPCH